MPSNRRPAKSLVSEVSSANREADEKRPEMTNGELASMLNVLETGQVHNIYGYVRLIREPNVNCTAKHPAPAIGTVGRVMTIVPSVYSNKEGCQHRHLVVSFFGFTRGWNMLAVDDCSARWVCENDVEATLFDA